MVGPITPKPRTSDLLQGVLNYIRTDAKKLPEDNSCPDALIKDAEKQGVKAEDVSKAYQIILGLLGPERSDFSKAEQHVISEFKGEFVDAADFLDIYKKAILGTILNTALQDEATLTMMNYFFSDLSNPKIPAKRRYEALFGFLHGIKDKVVGDEVKQQLEGLKDYVAKKYHGVVEPDADVAKPQKPGSDEQNSGVTAGKVARWGIFAASILTAVVSFFKKSWLGGAIGVVGALITGGWGYIKDAVTAPLFDIKWVPKDPAKKPQ